MTTNTSIANVSIAQEERTKAKHKQLQKLLRLQETLSEECRAHLSQLITEYRILPKDSDNPGAREILDTIHNRFKNSSETIEITQNDYFAFERALIAIKPLDLLIANAPSIRMRYQEMVSPQEYTQYLKSISHLTNNQPLEELEIPLRADLCRIISETHSLLVFRSAREKYRSLILFKTIIFTILLCGFHLSVFLYVLHRPAAFSPFVGVVALAALGGAAGGFISMQRRLQTVYSDGDPLMNITALRHGQTSIWLSPLNGAVFAVMIYMLFVGGILKGTVFPEIAEYPHKISTPNNTDTTSKTQTNTEYTPASKTAGSERTSFGESLRILDHAVPSSTTDYAKLFVFCFLAGFAERFVPDTLNRLVGNSKKTKPGESQQVA